MNLLGPDDVPADEEPDDAANENVRGEMSLSQHTRGAHKSRIAIARIGHPLAVPVFADYDGGERPRLCRVARGKRASAFFEVASPIAVQRPLTPGRDLEYGSHNNRASHCLQAFGSGPLQLGIVSGQTQRIKGTRGRKDRIPLTRPRGIRSEVKRTA